MNEFHYGDQFWSRKKVADYQIAVMELEHN